jgi:glycosyltransferase involved in cell wall biosynthesis
VLNLAVAQKSHAGIEPEILVQVPGAAHQFDTMFDGIPVHFLAAPDRLRSTTLFWFDARRLASRISALRPDFVHAHGTEDAYGLAAQRSRFPHVITLQGISFHINRIMSLPWASRARVVELTEAICLRRARDVIAKSEYVAMRLQEKFAHLTIHRIPNTIDSRLLEIRERKEPNVIAFVGTIIPLKGLDLLGDALQMVRSKMPDVTLWVFGDHKDAPSEYEQGIKKRFRAILGERVIFHGTLPNMEVARQVGRAAALVAPSREEMFGNQLVEALVVGTHGIVTEGTAMAENVVRFGGGIVVAQEDANALAQAIITAVTNPPHLPVAAVRKKIHDYMGPEVVARHHYNLYLELLNRS